MSTLTIEERLTFIVTEEETSANEFSCDVNTGLTSYPKSLPFVHFYDHTGSQLFEKICELPEYYLTRAETNILTIYVDEIISQFPKEITLVELGSGSAKKTRILIEAFLQGEGLSCYTPIDISRQMLEESSYELLKTYTDLEITAVAAHYDEGLNQLKSEGDQTKLITWLGSSIGNLDRPEAAKVLTRIQELIGPNDRLLIGIDLRKDKAILEKAYDDEQGVTAEFNLNLLTRINRELGGNFDLDTFHHEARYNEKIGRIEMYLTSSCEQKVFIEELNLDVSFTENEEIHTESSYKYSLEDINELAKTAGFYVEKQYFDPEKHFSINIFAPIT
ncbi:MAG: L-histidine N(alpha)-methyltransferase [Candidatus Scalindua sp. AMX11]|nr:MAG: L-histidine N(alpha)-methyltransferase [Candidatus Scalindua sp.]NOG83191.1 L-histidine N(alpha)-methyltransferase [Planctomycetota bacterium]RZV77556.1 MAG: L-histidine N(alpha)-methyltransferase [Candidatus Scalindua sp. SCAELEC01]TDE64564.1 MAG: L-histidine N(alpha)-methyltransferase [Candidatus Scalindua sp. AMX11]GJQ58622.1 MAG: dimethylhistidine N-methyltransferase [Candidatus Scalindua sp.]